MKCRAEMKGGCLELSITPETKEEHDALSEIAEFKIGVSEHYVENLVQARPIQDELDRLMKVKDVNATFYHKPSGVYFPIEEIKLNNMEFDEFKEDKDDE